MTGFLEYLRSVHHNGIDDLARDTGGSIAAGCWIAAGLCFAVVSGRGALLIRFAAQDVVNYRSSLPVGSKKEEVNDFQPRECPLSFETEILETCNVNQPPSFS